MRTAADQDDEQSRSFKGLFVAVATSPCFFEPNVNLPALCPETQRDAINQSCHYFLNQQGNKQGQANSRSSDGRGGFAHINPSGVFLAVHLHTPASFQLLFASDAFKRRLGGKLLEV